MAELWDHTAFELRDLVRSKETSAVEVATSVLERTNALEDKLHSFLTISEDVLMSQAREVDEGHDGPAGGVPIAIKDIFVTKGVRSTAASKILENYVPPYSSTVVERVAASGATMVGKTNLDEFAMGSSTENSAYGPSLNPWDTTRVPGGSSGGSAAAVASGQVPWALGTDTGGSIRQPCALCGIVGLKPTYGRVSRYGMIAFASSLDQAGPMTRTVKDAALLLSIIAGKDPMDATSLPDEVPDYLSTIEDGVKGLKIGIVKEVSGDGLQQGVATRFQEAVKILEGLGAEVGEISLPTFDHGIDVYYLIAPAEASSNLARYDGVRYGLRVDGATTEELHGNTRAAGFGDEVKRRIMLGTYSLSAGYYDQYYGQALKARTLIKQDFERAHESFDLLISPTSPTTAFKLGERTDDPLTMYLSDICNVPSSLAGACAITVPCGLAPEDGLPVGLQIMGKPLDEAMVLRAAYAFEQALGFAERPQL
jgi:aspartyl-tRNA(Asn)/glutamyl-tRNA(Gln) amidotransferase subunit A